MIPDGVSPAMTIPAELVPHCPVCGAPMSMNLRADGTFVEDDGWHAAARRYEDFLRRRSGKYMLFLELGSGRQYPRHSKIFLLEDDGGKSQSNLCLRQPGGSLCAGRNCRSCYLY